MKEIISAGNAGFTLIEMMVAMVILVALVSALYVCFVSVADTAEIARSSTEALRIQQYLRGHFVNNLSAVHASVSGEYAFVGEDGSGAFGPADTLTFTTTLPTSGAKSLPGIVKTVFYSIDDPGTSEAGGFQTFDLDAGEEKASVTLFITERPLTLVPLGGSDEEFFEEDEKYTWERAIPVRSLNFEYYDAVKEEWVDEWNSDESGMLPWAVRVGVNLAKTEEQLRADLAEGAGTEEEPDLSLLVVLPAGAGVISPDFIDPNHYRPSEQVDGGPSIFDDEK